MGRFQDFMTQNGLKVFLVNHATSYRRQIGRVRRREAKLIRDSAEAIRDYQVASLRELLRSARGASYWRALIDSIEKPVDEFTLDDLSRLPFLTKDLIRRHAGDMRIPSQGTYVNHSGGSTGEPIEFYQDERYRIHMSVATEACNGMAGVFAGARVAKLWGAPQDRRQIEGWLGRLKLWALNQRYYDSFDMGSERMQGYHEDLETFRPDLIQAYASSIELFATFLESRGIRPGYPRRAIISTAERLRPDARARIERVFRVPVFNRYGSREVSAIAAECERHDGLHVHMPGYIVETIDPATGIPVRDRPGELAITVLNNHAMPFLRYRIGDMGVLTGQPCSCGRRTDRLLDVLGRSSDNFVMPGGRIVHGEYFTHLFYGQPGVAQFQFEQESRSAFVLRLVPTPRFQVGDAVHFEREVRKVIGDGAQYRLEICGAIPKTASGKYRFTLSRVDAAAAAQPE
jgi:phenylacetate-CoA ligase